MYKVIIAGSRDFTNYALLASKVDFYLSNKSDIEIVSGTARGADSLGERYARERNYSIKRFPADWNTHGKKAGYLRNLDMAKYADACIVFWNGTSKGAQHMINIAVKHDVPLRIVRYDN